MKDVGLEIFVRFVSRELARLEGGNFKLGIVDNVHFLPPPGYIIDWFTTDDVAK